MNAVDLNSKPLFREDCVQHGEELYSVMGLMEMSGRDYVVVGDVMGEHLQSPYLIASTACEKVEL